MDTHTTSSEEILYNPDELAPQRRAWTRWRVAGWVAVAGIMGLAIVPVVMVVVDAVRESRREQCAVHLKRIGVAFHEYHGAHEHFPAPWLAGRDGKALLSWRVALLPHLGYKSLYDKFHLDEPWDSPHNRALLSGMPAEFACPQGPGRRAGQTGYLVVVGPITEPGNVNTPFEPTRGVEIREILDGTSNTILVFETNALIPWTKPDDLRWERDGPPPRLASPHVGGANVVFADGSARFLKATTAPNLLVASLTINGGEVFSSG